LGIHGSRISGFKRVTLSQSTLIASGCAKAGMEEALDQSQGETGSDDLSA
jgi:hypothetical protein